MTEFALPIPELEPSAKEILFNFFSCEGEGYFSFLENNDINVSFQMIQSEEETLRFKSKQPFLGIEFALVLQSFLNYYNIKKAFTFFEFDNIHCQTTRYILTRSQIISLTASGHEMCYETSDEEIKALLCREFVTAYENLQRFNNDEDQSLKDILFYLQKRHGTQSLKKAFEIRKNLSVKKEKSESS